MVPPGRRLSAFVQSETRPGPRSFSPSSGFPPWPASPWSQWTAQLDTAACGNPNASDEPSATEGPPALRTSGSQGYPESGH